MIKSNYKVLGVMSGTSLDGIDLVYTAFNFDSNWQFEIICAETLPYDKYWVNKLKGLVLLTENELQQIDKEYTVYLASKINRFIHKYKISEIDAICSHGHTALHQPENKLTYQIGNLPDLATLLQQTVVCDFRVQDVRLGGQGAPLVPIGDALLFSEFDYCLNLGGFANISTDINNKRVAYDICPVNIVLNYYVNQLGFDFDDSGSIASTGNVNQDLLNQLNNLGFYKEPYPKSLGLEWVYKNVIPLMDSFKLDIKGVLRTFVEHIAVQISEEINHKNNASVLITGGGVYHKLLIDKLKEKTNNAIVIPHKNIVEFKEALIFAFLGVLRLRGEVNCLQSVTGAQYDHSSGTIFYP
ncbi:anhydro-N-acetylmuramic acid kinase [Yeosuana aromativorans]|nr:anhydro-N-acetylmuramic acid kinase [Yeosuana aromativorans]